MKSSPLRGGFSLIEFLTTMAVMAVLVGVVSVRTGAVSTRAAASKIVELAARTKTACIAYTADTGVYALEYSGFVGPMYHRLSLDPSIEGWRGPYFKAPLTIRQNPAGTTVHLYAAAYYANGDGVDLDGDGAADRAPHAPCNVLVFWGISEKLARAVDGMLDRDVRGTWSNAGRVEWQSGNILTVLVNW